MQNQAKAAATPVERVRWIGPTSGPEFGRCYQLTQESMIVLTGPAEPVDLAPVELTIVACPRPTVDLTTVRDAARVGEAVQLLGVWCEGEGRTGRTADGVERVFWHAWPSWWRDRIAARHAREAIDPRGGPIWVRTQDAEFAASLVASLADDSISAAWAPADRLLVGAPAAILWDGAQLGGCEAARLAAVCRSARATATPVVALLDFPRPETVAAAEAIGAAAVLGKPFEQAALLQTLRTVVPSTRNPASNLLHLRQFPAQDEALEYAA